MPLAGGDLLPDEPDQLRDSRGMALHRRRQRLRAGLFSSPRGLEQRGPHEVSQAPLRRLWARRRARDPSPGEIFAAARPGYHALSSRVAEEIIAAYPEGD